MKLPDAVAALSAIAHEGRLAIYRLFVQTGPGGMTVGEIAAKIRENKTFQITSDIETGAARGMRTLDADLLALFNAGTIAEEEVFNYAQDAEMMRQRIKGPQR